MYNLMNVLAENKAILELDPGRMAEILVSSGHLQVNLSEVKEDDLIRHFESLNFGPSQFFVIGDSSLNEFIKVDSRVKDVLQIEPSELTLARICGLDDKHELFHPEDIPHILRLTSFAFIINSLRGVKIDPYKDYLQTRFRIGYSDQSQHLTIDRKIYISSRSHLTDKLFHFDIWTKTHHWERFEGVQAFIESPDHGKRNFMLVLMYTLNAMQLGISPKEVFLLKVIGSYKSNTTQLDALHELLFSKEEPDQRVFTDSQFKHLKRYLTQKIDKAILQTAHPLADKNKMQKASFNYKVSQLGLQKIPSCLEDIMLGWIRRESSYETKADSF